ncbi:hypothetical protein A2U01_0112203, partial [Trifolium medium]|nr:hypothetical protein [Trifolium medium]
MSGQGNGDNGNNRNNGHGGRRRNSEDPTFDDHGSSSDLPYEDRRRGRRNHHPGKTSFTTRILESR